MVLIMEKQNQTPTWQAAINTAAIALTGSGVIMLFNKDLFGLLLIATGGALEWFKYSRRFK